MKHNPLTFTTPVELLTWFEPNLPINEPHFTDDPEQVYLWSIHALDSHEMQAISLHLCRCTHCQEEIAEMVQCGTLSLETPEHQVVASPLSRNKARFLFRALIAACAVGIMGIVFCLNYYGHHSPSPIARIMSPEGNFPAAVDRDWLINDSSISIPLKEIVPQTELTSAEETIVDDSVFSAVSDSGRNTLAFRLAFGQCLFRSGQVAAAGEQFKIAITLNADSVEALLGSGLVAYSQEDYATALQLFEKAASSQSLIPLYRFISEYNAAKSSMKLENWDTAHTHWENARNLLNLPELSGDSEMQSLMEEIDYELGLF